jgi:putative membrane protein
MGPLISMIITLVVAALVIYIVGRLNLGMTVESYGAAIIAAVVIAVVSWVIVWLLGLVGITLTTATWFGWLVAMIVAALVLMFSDRFVSGMKVNGFTGALVAAIAIGVVGWLVAWVLGIFGITV